MFRKPLSFSLAVALAVSCLVLPAAAQDAADPLPSEVEAFRADLLGLIDRSIVVGRESGLPELLLERMSVARDRLVAAADDELEPLVADLAHPVAELAGATEALVAEMERAALEPATEKSSGLPGASYPNVSWSFFIEVFSEEPSGEGSNQNRSGVCSVPRMSPNLLFFSQNAVLINEATRDIADQLCDITVAGFNASAACIVTDILYLVQRGIFDNLILCEDLIDSAEVEGSFKRLGHIHTDLENAEANLTGEIDSAEALLKSEIDSAEATILARVDLAELNLTAEVNENQALLELILAEVQEGNDRLKALQAVQKQMIRLLLTPNGRRVVEDPTVLTCLGDACPNVLDCPGTECDYPVK